MSFRLYESEGCHLCDGAKQLILQTGIPKQGCELVDIAFQQQLVDRFGDSIPVLEHTESGQHLHWPFNLSQLLFWLKQFEIS